MQVPADDEPAETSADILAKIGESGWSALATAIKDERRVIRAGAAYGLWIAHEEATIPALLEALSNESDALREASASALAKVGNPRALPALDLATEDPVTGSAVAEAAQTIRALSEPSPRFLPVDDDWEPE